MAQKQILFWIISNAGMLEHGHFIQVYKHSYMPMPSIGYFAEACTHIYNIRNLLTAVY